MYSSDIKSDTEEIYLIDEYYWLFDCSEINIRYKKDKQIYVMAIHLFYWFKIRYKDECEIVFSIGLLLLN